MKCFFDMQKLKWRMGGILGGPDALKSRDVIKILQSPDTMLLGSGSHGEAYQIQYKGQEAVMKVLKFNGSLKGFRTEVDLLLRLKGAGGSPKVLAVTQLIRRKLKLVAAIMTLCGKLTLDIVLRDEICNDSDLLDLCSDLAHKLHEVQTCKIVHNDLKADNVLVTLHNEKFHTHIIDYGLGVPEGGNLGLKNSKWELHPWMAPEVTSGGPSQLWSDVFSLGSLLQEITGHMKGPPPPLLLKAISEALDHNPLLRPSLDLLIVDILMAIDEYED